jgi:hypothetical protein
MGEVRVSVGVLGQWRGAARLMVYLLCIAGCAGIAEVARISDFGSMESVRLFCEIIVVAGAATLLVHWHRRGTRAKAQPDSIAG